MFSRPMKSNWGGSIRHEKPRKDGNPEGRVYNRKGGLCSRRTVRRSADEGKLPVPAGSETGGYARMFIRRLRTGEIRR